VIFLFMHGGPSQVDTFDYKPLLQRDHGKPLPFAKPRVQFAETGNLLASPWKCAQHGASGAWVSELFPNVATKVDDLCFVKSLHGTNEAHGGALLALHTGSATFVRPSLGSWVLYGIGSENENLPGFLTICPTLGHGRRQQLVERVPAERVPRHSDRQCERARQGRVDRALVQRERRKRSPARRARLPAEINAEHRAARAADDALDARIASYELAFRMQTEAPEVMDLSAETEATKKLYGIDDPVTENFGRQCLMARRFAEAGVRFVQCTHSYKWDQHEQLKELHAKNALEVDKPIAGCWPTCARAGCSTTRSCSGPASSAARRPRRAPTAADHNPHGFTCGWPAAGRRPGRATARPTTTATTRASTRCTCTTCTRRCCTCSGSTTRSSPTATPAATSA
jgi:hypothetical protein